MSPSYFTQKLFWLGVIIRLILVQYGKIQDETNDVKYTDLDYQVYTEGAKYMISGESPYLRHTYRYTPVLAWMMIPNITLHPLFGKHLFVFVDMICGYLIQKILQLTTNYQQSQINKLVAIFILNPIVINISTRGSADSIIILLIFLTMYLLLKKQIVMSAIVYGLAVHFRIYPIIYSLPIYLYIDNEFKRKNMFQKFFTLSRIKFTLISASVFLSSVYVFYRIYGYQFLFESYLYHFSRKDNRHNFSIYFYFIYLYFENLNKILSTLSFLPQLTLVIFSGFKFYKDLPFCFFVQTFFFVIFNKVCTAQYFIWYICYFPLIFGNNNLYQESKLRFRFYLMGGLWLVFEILWNLTAISFEVQGQNTFLYIWIACILFFLVNIWIIKEFIQNQQVKQFTQIKEVKQNHKKVE